MYCSNCGEDATHGTGNCPSQVSSFRSEKNFVVPEGKVLIDQALYDELMAFAEKLNTEREAHTRYMRNYRAKKANG